MTLDRLTPTPDQARAISAMVHEPTRAALNVSELGTGKTLMTVEVAKGLNARTTLVICPLGTRVGWERTFKRQGWVAPILRIDSSKAGKEALAALKAGEMGVYLIGREYFRRLEWAKVTPDLAVFDEVHAVQNRKSVGFKRLMHLKPGYKLALSATPFRNRFTGAWSVSRWLWPENTDRSFWRWVAQHCSTEYDHFAPNNKKIVGERFPGRYLNMLPCVIQLKNTIKDAVTELRHIELTPTQRKMYREMEMNGVAWLEENPLVAELPISMRIRLRQMALGTVTFDEEGGIDFALDTKSAKIDALKEIISDLDDEPVLILTDSQKFARVVTHRLGDKAVEWSGKTSHGEREVILNTFGKEGGARYLVASIGAIGEGVDGIQHVCSNVVWLSKSEDGVMNDQALGRLVRTGQQRQVTSYEVIALNTWDENIMDNLLSQRLAMNITLRKGLDTADTAA